MINKFYTCQFLIKFNFEKKPLKFTYNDWVYRKIWSWKWVDDENSIFNCFIIIDKILRDIVRIILLDYEILQVCLLGWKSISVLFLL